MPSSEAIAACRRVCTSRPLRASTSSTARSERRCAGDHVAGVLLVAWRVGQDEAAARRLEEAICDVDGDALIALGRQAIDQQCIVDAALHRAEAFAVPIQRRHHVIGDGAAFEQQPADQRGLAIIDRAAGQHAQQGVRHQKYPSRFFFSIEASWSWSISRPARSETRVVRISATISSRLAAADVDRRGQRVAAERAEPHQPLHRLLARLGTASARRQPR